MDRVSERAEASRDRELQARMIEREELRGITDEALEVHGHQPGKNRGELSGLCMKTPTG